jgi:hypothetical protein
MTARSFSRPSSRRRSLELDGVRRECCARSPREFAAPMYQARTVQTRERIFYLDLIADFEHKLADSPRTLLLGHGQSVVGCLPR